MGDVLVVSAFTLGLRHGVDWDHLAAIADLTASGGPRPRALWLATLYALAHGAVVLVLGAVVVGFGGSIPDAVDPVMDRVVGATLVVLGLAVPVAMIRRRGRFRLASRWSMLASALGRDVVVDHEHDHDHDGLHDHDHDLDHAHAGEPATRAVQIRTGDVAGSELGVAGPEVGVVTGRRHRHRHRHVGTLPGDPTVTPASALTVGALHGVGAETPTQLLLFAAAAGAGRGAGMAAVAAFIAGVVVTNTGIALAAVAGLAGRRRSITVELAVASVVAGFSVALGVLLLAGRGDLLPGILA